MVVRSLLSPEARKTESLSASRLARTQSLRRLSWLIPEIRGTAARPCLSHRTQQQHARPHQFRTQQQLRLHQLTARLEGRRVLGGEQLGRLAQSRARVLVKLAVRDACACCCGRVRRSEASLLLPECGAVGRGGCERVDGRGRRTSARPTRTNALQQGCEELFVCRGREFERRR